MNNNDGAINFAVSLDNSRLAADAARTTAQLRGIGNAILPINLSLMGLAASLGIAGKEAFDFSREFETAFAEVKTISASARENADDIKRSILEMTTVIPVGAIDATKALYGIVSAGQDGANAMNVLEVSAKAAIAGVSTTALTSDIITTVINSYKLEANEALSISDRLFKTVELGKTTMTELGGSFAQVSALASSYGVSLNDILAAYATMTIAGTKTSEATTQIKSAIVLSIKKFGDQAFEGRTLSQVMQRLQDDAKKSGKTFIEYAGEVEAVNGALKLTGTNAAVFSTSLDKIANSAGATDAALAVMNETFDKQYTLLKNKLSVELAGFGDILKDLAGEPVSGFNRVLDIMSNKIDAVKIKGLTDDYEAFKSSLRGVTTEEEAQAKIAEKINDLQKKQIEQGVIVRAAEKDRPSKTEKVMMGTSEMIGQFTGIGSTGTFTREATFEAETANYKAITKQIDDLTALRKDSAAIRKATGAKTAAEIKAEADALKLTKKEEVDREKELVEALKLASGEKLKLVAQELVALQKLKELREKIVELALFEAKNPEPMSNQLNLPMFRKTGQKVTTANPTVYKAQDIIDESKESIKANNSQINALEEESLKKQVKLREDIFFAAESLTGVLTKNGMLSEEQGAVISESLNGFKALASGDFLGAAISIVSQIASMFPSQAEQFQARIDKINVALKEQQRLIELADRFGGERVALEKQLQLLKDKRAADGEALQRAEDKRDNKIFKLGPVYKGYVNDVKDLTAALVEDQNAIQDTEIALQDFLTGGITENTLADAIAQGFQDGKTSVDDFATYMNSVLTNAGVEIFKGLLLDSPEMKEYMAYVKEAYKGGILSPEEKAKIDQMAAGISATFAPAWDNLTGALDKANVNKPDAMQGGIKAVMTEDSASEIKGIWNGMRIDVREIINMSKASSNHLLNIAANTLRTADNTEQLSRMENVEKSLKSIDTAVNKTASRI